MVNVPAFDAAAGDKPLPALDLRLAELTATFASQTFGFPLAELAFAESYDAALAGGAKDFCLIQKVGHLFHGPSDAVAAALLAELNGCAFLTGHIMERGGYYYFHDQCVLVNRRAWEKMGRPAYGTPAQGPQRAAVPRRSAEDVHDDYTPRSLDPTGEERVWDGAFGYGWQAISASLAHGIRVENWSDAARAWKRNCYAYYGNPAEWQRTLSDVPAAPATKDDGLAGIADFLKSTAHKADGVDAFGDSATLDLPYLRWRRGIDTAVAPARGFDVHHILAQIGFHAATRLTFYDSNPANLNVRRRMIESWDGKDLAALDHLRRMGSGAGADDQGASVDAQLRRALAPTFATMDAWLQHWQRFRALAHDFVTADPVAEPDTFTTHCGLGDSANVVVSVSDRFNDLAAIARFDGARRRKAFDIIAAALKSRSRRYVLLGQPPFLRIRSA
jgi:hypothetical protein